MFSKLSDRAAEQLAGGKNSKWQQIPFDFDNEDTEEVPGLAPPGTANNFFEKGKAPKGLVQQEKQPKGWSQGFWSTVVELLLNT